MKPTILAFSLPVLAALSSCHQDDPAQPEPRLLSAFDSTRNYLPVRLGDRFVYRTYKIDTGGTETALNRYDTLTVSAIDSQGSRRHVTFTGYTYDIYGLIRNPLIIKDSAAVFWAFRIFPIMALRPSQQRTYVFPDVSPGTGDTVYVRSLTPMAPSVWQGNYSSALTASTPELIRVVYNNGPQKTQYYRFTQGIGLTVYPLYTFASDPDLYENRLVSWPRR